MEVLYSESDLDMADCGPGCHPQRARCQQQNLELGPEGVRKETPRHHRSPPGGPISVTSTAAIAAVAATTAAPAVTAATATSAGILPRLWGDLRGTWTFLAGSPHCMHEVPVAGFDYERVL